MTGAAVPPFERPFEEIRVGQTEAFYVEITEAQVRRFVELTGDYNPLHLDETYARRTSWGRRVVHGMLAASFFSALIGMHLPGWGAFWFDQSFRFLRPVFIGDRLEIRGTVRQVIAAERVLVLDLTVMNQRSETVISGAAKVRAPEVSRREEATMKGTVGPRVALVTGASRGIGAAIARELGARGFRVAINYRERQAEADEVGAQIRLQGGSAQTFQADLLEAGAATALVEAVVTALGGLSVLVNNAATPYPAIPFEQLDYEEVRRQLAINLEAPFRLIQAALPHLMASGDGLVVNVLSSAISEPPANAVHYVAAKSALEGLTKALAVEYGPKRVRFNMVSPGLVPTEFVKGVPERARKVYAMQTPLRRLAEPEDVARVVAFLASDDGSYLTGVNIPVTGGRVLG